MKQEKAKRRAIIIGGSMGGLFGGLLLRRHGWDVHIFERVPVELSGRGAGIVTHKALFEALHAAGIEADDTIGVQTPGRVIFDTDGRIVARRDLMQILTSWGRLHQLLRERFPSDRYHSGKMFTHYEEDGDDVVAHFDDGSSIRGDLLVGCDGFRSAVRARMLPEAQPKYAGYVAWRGMVNEEDLSERARKEMFPYFAFCLPEGEQMLGYPVAGEGNDVRPGKRRYNFVWYRPADAETMLREMLTGTDGREHEVSIAPTLIRPQFIEEMQSAAARILSPQFAELVAKTEGAFFQPIYDLTVPKMVAGKVALLGDAAFVGRPHCGMGVTKAAMDGMALAKALDDKPNSVDDALLAFNTDRQQVDDYVVSHARALGAYMQAQILTAEERENAEKHRSPEAVLRETATDFFLEREMDAL